MTNQNTYSLDPLPLDHIACIWWASAHDEYPAGWETVANWCHGAYSVAASAEDRETWHLLNMVAWDHAGWKRSFEEAA